MKPNDILVMLCYLEDGYISNTSVDVDYEAVKRKLLNSRKTNTSQLPPPPPDPPMMVNVKYSGSGRYRGSF